MRINIPKSVLLSVAILLTTHVAGLWQMILLSRILGVPLWMPYSALAVFYLLLVALLVLILRGKYWARAVYTVLGIFSFLSVLGHIADLSAVGWLVQAAKFVALTLLYVPTSNSWFTDRSPNNSFKGNRFAGPLN